MAHTSRSGWDPGTACLSLLDQNKASAALCNTPSSKLLFCLGIKRWEGQWNTGRGHPPLCGDKQMRPGCVWNPTPVCRKVKVKYPTGENPDGSVGHKRVRNFLHLKNLPPVLLADSCFLFHIEYLHSNRAATKAKHISLSVWLTSLNHGRLELPAEPLLNATNHGRLWNLTWRENYRISHNFGAASLSPIWGHRRLVEFRGKLAKRASLAIKCQAHVSWSVSLRCWACKLTRLPFALWNILKPTTEVVRENTS